MRIDDLKAMQIGVCFSFREKDGRLEKNPISAYGTKIGLQVFPIPTPILELYTMKLSRP